MDVNIENLYEAYIKTLNAENTINAEKNNIYRFTELSLPDRKNYAKGFKYNEGLIRDSYISKMGKLQEAYGKGNVGTVENTRKHIYNLMQKFAACDERARTYFDTMQQMENKTIDAFGADVDTTIQKVKNYIAGRSTEAVGHSSVNKIGNVVSVNYNSGLEATGHTRGEYIPHTSDINIGNAKYSEAHGKTIDSFASQVGYSDTPIKNSNAVGNVDYTAFDKSISDSIFSLPQ